MVAAGTASGVTVASALRCSLGQHRALRAYGTGDAFRRGA